jgi:hypothetical protein
VTRPPPFDFTVFSSYFPLLCASSSMLTHLFPFLDPTHITPDLVRRLRVLADDAARLLHSRSVSPVLLKGSPLLEDFVIAQTPLGLQLIGHVSGHPRLGDRMATTSPLWFADPDGAWVRTLSRFYRLGPPADPDDLRRIMAATAESYAGCDDDSSESAA